MTFNFQEGLMQQVSHSQASHAFSVFCWPLLVGFSNYMLILLSFVLVICFENTL